MVKFDVLRSQHDDALAMAGRLLDLADHYDPRSSGIPLVMQFNRLLGLLRVHLAQEDIELYPALVGSDDPKVARIAQRYVDEIGGLAIDLECFARRWSCSVSIAANIEEFREDAHQLMLALAVRIECENLHLYPLAEAEALRIGSEAA